MDFIHFHGSPRAGVGETLQFVSFSDSDHYLFSSESSAEAAREPLGLVSAECVLGGVWKWARGTARVAFTGGDSVVAAAIRSPESEL